MRATVTMRRLSLLLSVLAPQMLVAASPLEAQSSRDVQRLWIQATDGAVRHRDLVQPSMDSLIALGQDGVPHLLPYLHTEDAREKHAITDIFAGIGEPAVPDLMAVLGTGGEFHAVNTLMALGKIGAPAATAGVVPFVRDPRASVRSQAAETIGKCGGSEAEAALYIALRDTHEGVRKSAAVGLGRLGVVSAADSLVSALADVWFGVRYAAAAALVHLDSGRTAGDKLSALSGRPLALALHALAQAGTPGARAVAWRYIDHDDPVIRAEAAYLLSTAPRVDADRHRVEEQLHKEIHPAVRYHLSRALAREDS